MMKVGAIIQARTSATRLPRKVLLDLCGRTVLERVLERVRRAKCIEGVVVATTVNDEDAVIEQLCVKVEVPCFRGSQDDVLDRFYQTAKSHNFEHVVRITADCPLMDPGVIDQVVTLHLESIADYTSNTMHATYPDGEDVEVFSFAVLEKAWANANLASEREHVTPYLKKNASLFKLLNVTQKPDLSAFRWTLDEKADYEFIKTVYEALYVGKNDFGMQEVVAFLEAHPEVVAINADISRDQGYLKSLMNDKKVV